LQRPVQSAGYQCESRFRSLRIKPDGKLRRETERPRATLHAPLIQTRQRACHGHAASVWINNWPCEPWLTRAGGRERPMGEGAVRTITDFGQGGTLGRSNPRHTGCPVSMPRTGITCSTFGSGAHSTHRSPSLTGFQLAVGPTRRPLKAGGAKTHGPQRCANGGFPALRSAGGGEPWEMDPSDPRARPAGRLVRRCVRRAVRPQFHSREQCVRRHRQTRDVRGLRVVRGLLRQRNDCI
jgi:hypothetical protein